MKPGSATAPTVEAAVTRLAALAPLADSEVELLRAAAKLPRHFPVHREIQLEGQPVGGPSIILSGWACRVQIFRDGRRQILILLLPGDVIGLCSHRSAITAASAISLTDASLCPAPVVGSGLETPGLAEAYRRSRAMEEAYLLRQIARLGRLNAHERIADWLLELRDRLGLAGMVNGDSFPMPLTQEALADILGLTSVHVNRTLQSMRREGLIDLRGGTMRLIDIPRLETLVGYRPARVSSDAPNGAGPND